MTPGRSLAPRRRFRMPALYALVLLVPSALLAGCSSDPDLGKPKEAVQAWLKAQEDGDAEALVDLTLPAAGQDWVADTPWLATRTSGITDADVGRVEVDEHDASARVHVTWKVRGGKSVATVLKLERVGKKYMVKVPDDKVPTLSPDKLSSPDSKLRPDWVGATTPHLSRMLVPDCAGDGKDTWCFDANGNYDFSADARHLPMLPFGTYEYETSARVRGVTGTSKVKAVVSDYGDTQVGVEPGLRVRPAMVKEIDRALGEYIKKCPVVGPEESGDCTAPHADSRMVPQTAGWRISAGGPVSSGQARLEVQARAAVQGGAGKRKHLAFDYGDGIRPAE